MDDEFLKIEHNTLRFSAILGGIFAFAGLVIGLWVGSIVILFDGVYSLLSLLLTLLSLYASRLIQLSNPTRFPVGRATLEPLVIVIKASAILIIVLYSLYSALVALWTGGRAVDPSLATLFGLFNVIGCGLTWWYIHHMRHKSNKENPTHSGLLLAEQKQWQMDTLLSVAVSIGFLSAWLISVSAWPEYTRYADPTIMLLMGSYFIKVPFDMLRLAVKELLLTCAAKELQQQAHELVMRLNSQTPLHLSYRNAIKIGPELWVYIEVDNHHRHVEQQDNLGQLTALFHAEQHQLPLTMIPYFHLIPDDITYTDQLTKP